jgi:hypothetical protein
VVVGVAGEREGRTILESGGDRPTLRGGRGSSPARGVAVCVLAAVPLSIVSRAGLVLGHGDSSLGRRQDPGGGVPVLLTPEGWAGRERMA